MSNGSTALFWAILAMEISLPACSAEGGNASDVETDGGDSVQDSRETDAGEQRSDGGMAQPERSTGDGGSTDSGNGNSADAGRSGGDGGQAIGVDDDKEVNNLWIVVDGASRRTSSTSSFPVTGRVLARRDAPLPSQLSWEHTAGNLIANDTIAVQSNGVFAGTIGLVDGDNTIVFSLEQSTATAKIDVTVNPDYLFGSPLTLSADVAYVGEAREIRAKILLTDPVTNPSAVHLVQVNEKEELEVATLGDFGDTAAGDDLAGDGYYGGVFAIDEGAPGVLYYRVVVERTDTADLARSSTLDVLVTEHLTEEDVSMMLDKLATYETELSEAVDANAAVDSVAAKLRQDDEVIDFGTSESSVGVWMIFRSGVAAAVSVPAPDTKGSGPPTEEKFALPILRQESNQVAGARVESSKALLIAAQHFAPSLGGFGDSDDVPDLSEALKRNGCFDVTYKKYQTPGSGNIEDFKHLERYGLVAISTHGDSFYQGIDPSVDGVFGWSGAGGQVVLHSNMATSTSNLKEYEDDLKRGRLAVWRTRRGSYYAILPSFIGHYSGALPNSVVYMSACKSSWNFTMEDAFLGIGASAFLGYTDYVGVSFARTVAQSLFSALLTQGTTVHSAFTPGLVETDATPAEFTLAGEGDVSLSACARVSCGRAFSCAVVDGVAKCWGANNYGQLGDGTTISSQVPVIVSGLDHVVALDSGGSHSCAVLQDASVKCWGDNTYGQLGDGTLTDSSVPVTVAGLSDVTSLSSGWDHVCALVSGGNVYCWGLDVTKPPESANHIYVPTPTLVPGLSAAAISAEGGVSCALASSSVTCWGNNLVGQLGRGTSTNDQYDLVPVSGLSNVVSIDTGYASTLALMSDGTVKMWGQSSTAIGSSYRTVPYTPFAFDNVSAVANGPLGGGCVLLEGTVTCWGYLYNQAFFTRTIPDLSGVTQLAVGDDHTCAVLSDGAIKCWTNDDGSGQPGELTEVEW